MIPQLREKKVGQYTVRELSMRRTMEVLRQYPQDDTTTDQQREERGAALLGASVFNGAAEPLGVSVLELGAGVYRALMSAHAEINNAFSNAEGEPGNG